MFNAATLVLVLLLVCGCNQENLEQQRAIKKSNETQVDVDFASLDWHNLQDALVSTLKRKSRRRKLQVFVETSEHAPAIYLEALCQLAENRLQDALGQFSKIDVSDIIPAYLYAPFRLTEQLAAGGANPYLLPLMRAVKRNELPPLIQARINTLRGKSLLAISQYLPSDPKNRTLYDVAKLQRLKLVSERKSEVDRIVLAALRGGRLKNKIASLLSTSNNSKPELTPEFKNRLRQAIKRKGLAATIAINSARQILRFRKYFVDEKYLMLLYSIKDSPPEQLTTETITLCFLSSIHLKDVIQIELWGDELKRRHSEKEVGLWVDHLSKRII